MSRPSVRWHDYLNSISSKQPGDEAKNRFAYKQGWKVHEKIQADFPGLHTEAFDTFTDPSLPFDIGYHPDMYDAARKIVYEIKPLGWFKENTAYCVAQLSGYCHFKDATGVFLLYTAGGYAGAPMPYVRTWEELKAIALRSWQVKSRLSQPAPS